MKLYPKIKRLFDVLFSFCVVIISSPIFLTIAIAVKASSRGPVIFKQKRLGSNKKTFTLYKFRTMPKNAEQLKEKYKHLDYTDGPVFKIKSDPRLTQLGRFLSQTNLDELPQFFNVLKGDMSIVGYRPPIPDEVCKYKKWQLERFKGIPGITSLWAVSGCHKIKFNDWIKMDISYNQNISFLLDLKIIAKTGLGIIKNIVGRS